MIISWNKDNEPIETKKAYGFKYNKAILWFPKSQIKIDRDARIANVPDWLYDKKVNNEIFSIIDEGSYKDE